MCPSESLAFKRQPSHRCFPRDGVKRPCIPLNRMPQAHGSLALQPGRTCLQAAGEPMVSSCCQRTAKDLTNIRLSIPGTQTAPEEVRLTGGTECQQNLTSLLSIWLGPKRSPEKLVPAFRVAKSILYSSSPPQMYLSQALHSARY